MSRTNLSLGKRLIVIAVLLFLGLGLSAIVVEAAARLFFPTPDFMWQWDPLIGMKLVPNKTGRSIKKGIFDVEVRVNSSGFRDREHALEKPPGTRRIVLLGDSFLEAIQVPFEESVTPLLEARMSDLIGPVETINLGVSGAGTAREYLSLEHYGLQYQPDLVLLFFVGNDVSDNSRRLKGLPYLPYPQTGDSGELLRDEAGRPRFTRFQDQSSRLSFLTQGLRDYSKGYRFVRETMDTSPALNRLLYNLRLVSTPPETVNAPSGDNFGFYEIYRVTPKPEWKEAWHLTEELLVAAHNLSQSNGAQFAVVLIPSAWDIDPAAWDSILDRLPAMRQTPVDRDYPTMRLKTYLSSHNVPVINLLPTFRAHPSPSSLYVRDDAHWTFDGHKLATETLADPVRAFFDGAQR